MLMLFLVSMLRIVLPWANSPMFEHFCVKHLQYCEPSGLVQDNSEILAVSPHTFTHTKVLGLDLGTLVSWPLAPTAFR